MNTIEINSIIPPNFLQGNNVPGKIHTYKKGRELAESLGYPVEVLDSLPVQTVDSFSGIGYYFDLADLQKGEKVVALEGTPEMDAFFAAKKVGDEGYVTAISNSDEKLNNANSLVFVYQLKNMLFRKGHSEDIPLKEQSADIVIFNSANKILADKEMLFKEIARILKRRGRLAMSMLVTEKHLLAQTGSGGLNTMHHVWLKKDLMDSIENACLQIQKVNYNHEAYFLPGISGESIKKYGVIAISLLAYKV